MNSKLKKCNNFGKQSDFLNMGKKLETEILKSKCEVGNLKKKKNGKIAH